MACIQGFSEPKTGRELAHLIGVFLADQFPSLMPCTNTEEGGGDIRIDLNDDGETEIRIGPPEGSGSKGVVLPEDRPRTISLTEMELEMVMAAREKAKRRA